LLLRIGVAQLNPTVGALDANAAAIIEWTAAARSAGCDLVCFPELAITGYPPEDLLLKPGFISDAAEALAKVSAAASGIVALVGVPHRDGDLYNAVAICADGAVAGFYHKRLLPNYGVFDEKRYFAAGSSAGPLLRIGDAVLGVTVCEDVWLPDGPLLDQARAGIDLAVNVNGSPYHVGKHAFRRAMYATRAADVAAPLVFVNMVGGQDELVFDGGSMLFDAEGEILAAAPQFVEALYVWDVDCSQAFRRRLRDSRPRSWSRLDLPVLDLGDPLGKRGAAPAVWQPIGDRPSRLPAPNPGPMSRTEEVYRALVTGVHDYLAKNGFTSAVVGLSGGIDSALTATIAVDAVGAGAVHGLTMPSPYSSPGSVIDSETLAAHLGIGIDVVPITGLFEAFLETLAPVFAGTDSGLARENLQARIRGNILMAYSNSHGAILLTTGNKSEMATGYCTLYGDMAGGFAVLLDVPKTLVYELCRWRNSIAGVPLIPEAILEKPPSAELRAGQLDTDSLPPYEVLDPILEAYVEADMTGAEIVAAGIAPADVVARVVRLVDGAEYKRRQAPPGVRITPKAFGRDRRLPITNASGS
jgi:NAD+ synthase (glutamine-hydrolysing)